jgi:hypothetical protein
MSSIEEYLKDTEPAIRHLFGGLSSYDLMRPPSILPYIDKTGHVKMSKQEADGFVQAHLDSFAFDTSRAILAGSILQIAYMAIRLYSKKGKANIKYQQFGITENNSNLFVGREVHGIPLGLLIYAGRIQYSHWDEGEPDNKLASKVFAHLRSIYYDDLLSDMVYELDYPGHSPKSHYILRGELRWKDIDDYLKDMREMLVENG